MGTRDRRRRDIAGREQIFLDAARDLIRAEGLLRLQMSRLADQCEYAVGTLYQHFTSKEDLLLALVTQEVRLHVELFSRVARWSAPSRDRLFAIAVADMLFARHHPAHFQLAQYAMCEVVWRAASPSRRQVFLDLGEPVGDIVHSIVRDGVAAGDVDLRGQSAEEVASGVWALCAGYQNLIHTEGMLRGQRDGGPYLTMFRHVQHLLNGLAWQPLRDATDEAGLRTLIDRIRREVLVEL